MLRVKELDTNLLSVRPDLSSSIFADFKACPNTSCLLKLLTCPEAAITVSLIHLTHRLRTPIYQLRLQGSRSPYQIDLDMPTCQQDNPIPPLTALWTSSGLHLARDSSETSWGRVCPHLFRQYRQIYYWFDDMRRHFSMSQLTPVHVRFLLDLQALILRQLSVFLAVLLETS